jgi:biotin carboxyl carrier protein
MMKPVVLACGGEEREIRIESGAAFVGGTRLPFREVRRGGALVALEIGGDIVPVRVARSADRVFVWCAGNSFELGRVSSVRSPARRGASGDAPAGLVAPMPGRIRRTLVETGQEIAKGDVVLVLEAMKMEHVIRAPHDGVVTRIEHREGDLVEAGAVLAEIR